MRIIGDRSRTRLLDRLIKDKKNRWASLVVVGVKDDLEAKSLLQWCRNLALTVVWRVAPGAGRQEKQRQEFARDRMRKWAAIYKRFTLVEAATADAPEMLDGQQFDAVALWGLTPAQLAAEGPAWAGLVRDGGALVGLDHRVVDCRRVLNAAVPEWSALRDGVWSVKVKRSQPSAGGSDDGVNGAVEQSIGQGLGDRVNSHDPVDSRPDADAESRRNLRDDLALPPVRPVLSLADEHAPLQADHDAAVGLILDANGDGHHVGVAIVDDHAVGVGGDSGLHADDIAQPAPKRRGRPPGSKNRAPGVAVARGRKATA